MTLAEKLTQARKAAGLTQADSAEKLNVSRQAVSLWESGQSRPSTDKLSALAKSIPCRWIGCAAAQMSLSLTSRQHIHVRNWNQQNRQNSGRKA